jgi:hypothetical protein
MTPENWYISSLTANRAAETPGHILPAPHPRGNASAPLASAAGGTRRNRRHEPRFAVYEHAWLRVLDPLSLTRIEAAVVEVSRLGMKIQVPVQLHVSTTVQIHLSYAIALGEVRHTEPLKSGFVSGLLLKDVCRIDLRRDARQEPRFPVNVPGILRNPVAPAMGHEICVLDASKSGLRIRSNGEIAPAGTHVDIECSGATIRGEVRYVRFVDQGEFNLGIRAYSVKRDPQPQEVATGNEKPEDTLDLTLIFYPEDHLDSGTSRSAGSSTVTDQSIPAASTTR